MSKQNNSGVSKADPKVVYRTEGDVVLALRDHFPKGEYVVIPQVRNGAGFEATRTADAIVMSLWPSRGLSLFGIEIKTYRGDWVRELKNPKKADEVARFCDYWVVAVGNEAIVEDGELPDGWGLLVPGKNPGTLKMKVQPKKLEPVPLAAGFLAAVLKRALDVVVPLADVDTEIERRVEIRVAEKEVALRRSYEQNFEPAQLKKRNEELEAAARAFYEETDIWLHAADVRAYKKLGKALQLLRYQGTAEWLQNASSSLKASAKNIEALIKALPPSLQPEKDAAA